MTSEEADKLHELQLAKIDELLERLTNGQAAAARKRITPEGLQRAKEILDA